jgi:AAA domain
VDEVPEFAGQDRAFKAVQFGTGISGEGFNLFLLGSTGTGKFCNVRSYLQNKAAGELTPDDWWHRRRSKGLVQITLASD